MTTSDTTMTRPTRTQLLVLAGAARHPLIYELWADGYSQARLELHDGWQTVKTPTIRALLNKGLLSLPEGFPGEDRLRVTDAGLAILKAAPEIIAEVSSPGWRLTPTAEHRTEFTIGSTKFLIITSGWPNSVIVNSVGQHIAHAVNALFRRTPAKYERELAKFGVGAESDAFTAIVMEAFDTVCLLHPDLERYDPKFQFSVSDNQ